VSAGATGTFTCKLCRGTNVASQYLLQRHTKNTELFTAATCSGCGLFQNVYDWHRIRTLGTSLCDLQLADNFGGGAHVSLLGGRPLRWLASRYPLTLLKTYYTNSTATRIDTLRRPSPPSTGCRSRSATQSSP
jgi:hypothetical protein